MNRNLSRAQFHARFGSEYPRVDILGFAMSKMGGKPSGIRDPAAVRSLERNRTHPLDPERESKN